ncbi:MAG TPA: HD domain-containing protein [Candidatus Woesebacteria bacterium]|nr:HD domain-containing protein [Candidatus Woesebacteria bacterium]
MTNQLTQLTHYLYELGTLRKIARSHRQSLLTDDLSDNISSHSFRVIAIGWFLSKLEKADPYKVLLMCLLHDTSETRTGDQNWIHKKYVKTYEQEVIFDQFSKLPGSDELLEISKEYEGRESKEAKLAKDADLLDQILLLKEYSWQGNQEATVWLQDNEQAKRLSSPSAQKIAQEIIVQNPSDWWNTGGWSADRKK